MLECATLTVPVDYSDESAGTTDLALNILRSENPDARIGYLFTNPGGPGASALEFVSGAAVGWPPELRDAFDIVGVEPRGVGDSGITFACGEGREQFDLLSQIEDPPDEPVEVELGREAIALCVESMGPAAMQVGSMAVVDDMEAVRRALGADQVSFLGFSYGTRLGGFYASMYPESLRAVVLDAAPNPVQPDDTVEDLMAAHHLLFGPWHAQFEAALLSCADESCPIWNEGDPMGYWLDTIDSLPILVEAAGGSTVAKIQALNGFLYAEDAWPILHDGIAALREGDDPSVLIDVGLTISTLGADPTAASFTGHVNCLDGFAVDPDDSFATYVALASDAAPLIEQSISEDYPLLDGVVNDLTADPCVHFGSFDPPALDGPLDGGGIPILVIGNGSDQVTPLVASEQYAKDVLANGYLVTTDHFQHGVYPLNSCVVEAVHAALLQTEYADVTCAREDPEPIEYDASWDDIELVMTELPNGGAGLVPEGWLEVAPGVWSRPVDDIADQALLAYAPSGGSVEAGVAQAEEQMGGTAEILSEFPGDGVIWSVFDIEVEVEGVLQIALFAVSDSADGIVIFAQGGVETIDPLVMLVLQPAVAAYEAPEPQ